MHFFIEIIALGNAIVAGLIFWHFSNLDKYNVSMKLIRSLNLIRSMIMYRFIFFIFNIAASVYIDKMVFKGSEFIFSFSEGLELINEYEWEVRKRAIRRPIIRNSIKNQSIPFNEYRSKL